MKIHSKIKPFVCKICGGRYSRSSTLKIHSYTHLEEKPFKCPYKECNRGFTEKGNLQVHLKTHMKSTLTPNSNEILLPSSTATTTTNNVDKAHTKHNEQVNSFIGDGMYNFNMNTYNTNTINIYNCIYPFPYQIQNQLQHNYFNQQQQQQIVDNTCCVRNDVNNCYVMVPQQNKQTYLQYSMLYRYGLI